MAQNKDLVADAQTLLEENLSEKKSVESARRLTGKDRNGFVLVAYPKRCGSVAKRNGSKRSRVEAKPIITVMGTRVYEVLESFQQYHKL